MVDQVKSRDSRQAIFWVGVVLLITVFGCGGIVLAGVLPTFKPYVIGVGVVALVVVIALTGFVYAKILSGESGRPDNEKTDGSASILDLAESRSLRTVVVGAGALVFATFAWAGSFVFFKMNHSEIALPVVIIAGLVVLVMVLGLLTFVFSVLKLSDSKEALGLPSGSIRAVIALMLLVVFAIVSIFLYSDVASSGRLLTAEKVTEAQLVDWKKQVDVVLVIENNPPGTGASDTAGGASGAASKTYTVHYRNPVSKSGEDLAKQLVVLLGTLVTAVSSFYFGSNSIAAATKAVSGMGGPNAASVAPSNLKPGEGPQSLTISGTNLSRVGLVELAADGKPSIFADAGSIVANETTVTCKVPLEKDAEFGPWDVVVSDNANNFSRMPKSVTIGSRAAGSALDADKTAKAEADRIAAEKVEADKVAAAEKTEADGIAAEKAAAAQEAAQPGEAAKSQEIKDQEIKSHEISLTAGGDEQELTFAAPDLPATVTSLKLTRAQADPIQARDGTVSRTADGVTCRIAIPLTAVLGAWDIVVSDQNGAATTVQNKKVRITAA